jgi:hypothetical protein
MLCQCLGECVRNLVFCADGEYLDDVFTEVMVAQINVLLSTWVWLGRPCKFQSVRVVFKCLAVYMRLAADDLEVLLSHFLQYARDGNGCHVELVI